jgi:hypothetical protein
MSEGRELIIEPHIRLLLIMYAFATKTILGKKKQHAELGS